MARITRVECSDLVMPKTDPSWRFALGAKPESSGILVRMEVDEGTTGYGVATEIAHLGYDLETVRHSVRRLAEHVEGRDPRDWRSWTSRLPLEIAACRPAIAAVEMAMSDAAARLANIPLYRLLGGAYRTEIPILRILALKSPEDVAMNARLLSGQGYRYLKIKLDNEDMELDAARVAAVREAVGEEVHLTLDANQSYSAKEAVSLYRKVEDFRIDLFEQPVPARDFDGLRFVTQEVGCFVEADESAGSLDDVWRLLQMRAVDAISLKVLKLGGLAAMAEAAAVCRAAHVRCRVGATVGSRLLTAAAMHFVASTPNIDFACELGEFERLHGDPFEGLEVHEGVLRVPEEPGIGVRRKKEA